MIVSPPLIAAASGPSAQDTTERRPVVAPRNLRPSRRCPGPVSPLSVVSAQETQVSRAPRGSLLWWWTGRVGWRIDFVDAALAVARGTPNTPFIRQCPQNAAAEGTDYQIGTHVVLVTHNRGVLVTHAKGRVLAARVT